MIFQRLNRTNPERIFMVVRPNEAGVAADDTLQLSVNTASNDGTWVEQPSSALLATTLFVGVADAAIASGAFGLCQVYGYRSTSRVLASNADQAAGVALAAVSDQDYLSSFASTANVTPLAVLIASATSSTGSVSRAIFLRTM